MAPRLTKRRAFARLFTPFPTPFLMTPRPHALVHFVAPRPRLTPWRRLGGALARLLEHCLQEMVMKKYRVKTSHNQCSRARRIAIYSLKQNVGDQYDRLIDYAGELRQTNPGTTVQLRIDPLIDGTHMFNSFYICFHNLKQGWKAGCRKVIGMDGCFLQGVCQGQLLAAIGRDENNQIYPIA